MKKALFLFLIISSAAVFPAFSADTPDFTGRQLDVSFNDLLSGAEYSTVNPSETRLGTLIVFWSVSCGPCLREIPELNALYSDWRPLGLEIFGFPQDERPEQIISLSRRFGITWPQNLESGRPFEKPTPAAWQIRHTPSFILLDSAGKVLDYDFLDPVETVEKHFR